MSKQLSDNFGRKITYLRVAITDRCNLRCKYCMPENGIQSIPHENVLTFEEHLRIIRLSSKFGVNKIRVTGGEPFVRKGIIKFLRDVKQISGIENIHITTNGISTSKFADVLNEIGISGINLSLDTLDEQRFHKITRRDLFANVWKSIQKIIELEIPLKINAVIQNDFNTDEIIPLANLAKEYPIDVRFIEEMPFNGTGKFTSKPFTGKQIYQTLEEEYPDIEQILNNGSTAKMYKIPEFTGKVGIIGAYSRTFCSACNRIRLTSTGMLKTCLYDDGILNLKDLLRSNASDSDIIREIQNSIGNRNKDGFVSESLKKTKNYNAMVNIGG
ncbi:MAG: GTP 3',8-cyclase MoaA [Candidatus Marinimicrobia bacterium]|nr:GTP 3',8-cyclase MoaA [Candidatus Neomarinimicrobiota bacterium]MBL7023735.1 GTP 3',8-cyclase MoaA [Candidatus Neomarinimicrobiota bacterium]MBL7109595.1 GTP 3',8-cyclase MoaA [Candidatus Neomarinimicrobiota bacterium]